MSLSKALRKRLAQFHARLQRLHDDASPKNVHEFRVACRELLACYPLLKLLSSAKGVKPILKKALRSLGSQATADKYNQPGKFTTIIGYEWTPLTDVATATWPDSIGAPELATEGKDPDFEPSQRAFYYARVIEIPTPRWTARDQVRFGIKMSDDVPMKQQGRDWSWPILYTPSS